MFNTKSLPDLLNEKQYCLHIEDIDRIRWIDHEISLRAQNKKDKRSRNWNAYHNKEIQNWKDKIEQDLEQLDEKWNKKQNHLCTYLAIKEEALIKRHEQELQSFWQKHNNIRITDRKTVWTYNEWKRGEVLLIQQRRYDEAEKIKKKAESLWERNNDRKFLDASVSIKNQYDKWLIKQKKEKDGFNYEYKQQNELWNTLKEKEYERLKRNYYNRKGELEIAQQCEMTNKNPSEFKRRYFRRQFSVGWEDTRCSEEEKTLRTMNKFIKTSSCIDFRRVPKEKMQTVLLRNNYLIFKKI